MVTAGGRWRRQHTTKFCDLYSNEKISQVNPYAKIRLNPIQTRIISSPKFHTVVLLASILQVFRLYSTLTRSDVVMHPSQARLRGRIADILDRLTIDVQLNGREKSIIHVKWNFSTVAYVTASYTDKHAIAASATAEVIWFPERQLRCTITSSGSGLYTVSHKNVTLFSIITLRRFLVDFYTFCTNGNMKNTLQFVCLLAWWRNRCITSYIT